MLRSRPLQALFKDSSGRLLPGPLFCSCKKRTFLCLARSFSHDPTFLGTGALYPCARCSWGLCFPSDRSHWPANCRPAVMRRRGTKEDRPPGIHRESELDGEENSGKRDAAARLTRQVKGARVSAGRVSSFNSSVGGLLCLALLYVPVIYLAKKGMYQELVTPLPQNVPSNRISEGRMMEHVRYLATDIGIRQEGSRGLSKAANYLRSKLEELQARASPDIRVEVDELVVSGSFNIIFLRHSISNTYRDHFNLFMRLSSKEHSEDAPSVLVNGHFDGPLGSPAAADCATCVGSMLEVARYIIDTNWVPPAPIIFLFNGAEEVYMLAAHGFVQNYKLWASIGAVINVEASGASGPDLVVQSGPGAWPSRVYAESAVYPMANSAAQDVFPLIPGDTDFRIFSQDFGDVPGLDIIFILEGYVYHTAYDTPDRIVPGSLQVRGENLFALLQGFTTAPELMGAAERATIKDVWAAETRPVYFDLFGRFMIYYPFKVAIVLHLVPLIVVLAVIGVTTMEELPTVSERLGYIGQGVVLHVLGMVFAVIFPVALAIARLSTSSRAMTWFAHPWMAILMFGPISIAGLLIPKAALNAGIRKPTIGQEALNWSNHWAAVGVNALVAAVFTLLGLGSGFLPFWWAVFMIPALALFRKFQRLFGEHSIVSMLGYIVPAALPTAYSVQFGGVFIIFIAEKMGMSGTFPKPFGFYVADVILALIVGAIIAITMAPVIPIVGNWIAKPHTLRLLIYISIGTAALSGVMFPYSERAPKRVVFQQTLQTEGAEIVQSTYDFATVDPNPMSFVFMHSPKVVSKLQLNLPLPEENVYFADPVKWTALFPISTLLNRGPRVLAPVGIHGSEGREVPQIRVLRVDNGSGPGGRRVHMELDLGSLDEVWSTVMNVTGPLSSWSFADGHLPVPESIFEGPPSFMCRLSGRRANESWRFWFEANGTEPLRIELGVLDQKLDPEAEALVGLFPPWAAVTAGTSYVSSYAV